MIGSVRSRMVRLLLSVLAVVCLTVPLCLSALSVSAPAQVQTVKASPSYNSVKLTWSKISNCTGYAVFAYNPSSQKYTVLANVKANTCTVKNLKENTVYYYAVQAYTTYNSQRYYGKVSKAVSVRTTLKPPAQVKNVKAASNTTQVKLTWSAVSSAKYAIYSYNPSTKKYTRLATTSATSYLIKNLKPGTTYYFTVRSYRVQGEKMFPGKTSAIVKIATKEQELTLKNARNLFLKARTVYMDWIYSCSFLSYENTQKLEFYGMMCDFAPVKHPTVSSKADLENLLSKYFSKEIYANELYLYREINGVLYYYAEGGAGEPDSGTKYYSEKLVKVNSKKYRYILYPTYYPGYNDSNSPSSYTFTVEKRGNLWLFTGKFYTCFANIV